MTASQSIIVFGDQTTDFRPGLRRLLGVENNYVLSSFFERVYFTIRKEISHLSSTEKQLFPRFTSIIDLLARYEETDGHAVLECTLTTIYHLASFIQFHTAHGRDYPSPTSTRVMGLCTGLFAAAAVSSSKSMGDLLPAAVEAVMASMRVGLRVFKMGQIIEPFAKASDTWSVLILGVRAQDAVGIVRAYTHQNQLSTGSQLYVSAVSANSVTVSGPPALVQRFITNNPTLRNYANVQIHAPYHAPHLFDDSDVEALGSAEKLSVELATRAPVLPFISSVTGQPVQADDFATLLKTAVKETLREPLRLDNVFDNVPQSISAAGTGSCSILAFATSIGSSLASSLKGQNVDATLVDTSSGIQDKRSDTGPRYSTGRAKIAIIGLSGRFPEAPGHEQFWKLLEKGLDVHKPVPSDRFGKEHYDPTGQRKNTSKVQNGCWINEPGMFDARFFNLSPREAAQADPGQRLALQTAYEALEMAGVVPDSTPSTQRDRFGVFYGMTSDDYREVNSGQDIDTYFIPGGNRAFTPGRINYYFKFSGPSVSVDTACSSSLSAINMACNSLWRNDCDAAIAGGTNIMTNPDNFAGLDKGHFLTHKGNCNTFDDEADGYCRADAVGTVVLKRLDDALADNDPILGVILGAYTNHSAESVSITRPHAGAQEFIFQKLLNESGVHQHDISYVEMHGTGTQAGDAAEMTSVLSAFAPDYTRKPDQPLYLGSVKSNVGHSESASGVTSLIKVLLMLQKNLIPPHCGIKTRINHTFPTDFDERNVHIAFKPTPWNPSKAGPRRAFVNNFSAAGGNTALLLEEGPKYSEVAQPDPRSTHVITVTAKSRTALQKNINSLISYMDTYSKDPQKNTEFLGRLSYTLTARRMHHPYRVAVCGSTVVEIQSSLEAVDCNVVKPVSTSPGPVVFVFTGQGAQYAGMGQHLFANLSEFRADVLLFDTMVKREGLPSILPLVDGTISADTPNSEIDPLVLQLGATCLQLALTRLWKSFGIQPRYVVGHSLGEYAALAAAGVLTASDTIQLACARARLLQRYCQAGTHAMLAVRASRETLAPYLKSSACEVACINGPEDTVISGRENAISSLASLLNADRIKCTKLQVPYAFHSSQVDPILDEFEATAHAVTFHEPAVPVISSLLGDVVTKGGVFGPQYLRRHCREKVDFHGALVAAQQAQLTPPEKTIWIEVGSHPICSAMVKSTVGVKSITLPTLHRKENTWKTFSSTLASLFLAGIEPSWREYHRDFATSQQVLQLPAYNWDNKNYWIQYEHSWTLTKGNPPTILESDGQSKEEKFSTASVHSIVSENQEANGATVVMQSDLAHPELQRVCQGHLINGVPLCPSSLYADIAETMGKYLLETHKPEFQNYGVDVRDMSVDKPLIYKGTNSQPFRASVTADWGTMDAKMTIYSVNQEGNKTVEHATCRLQFGEPGKWLKEWQRISYHIKRSILHLENGVEDGVCSRFRSGMAYKLFATLVDYQPDYKGFRDIILDSESYEATATVKFQTPDRGFKRNPVWIDSCGQLTGFTLNANDATSKDQVYVNHGWESVRFAKNFDYEKVYRTYVRMLPVGETKYAGDLFVLDDDEIIAVYSAVTFQAIPRRLLEIALPPPSQSKALTSPARKELTNSVASSSSKESGRDSLKKVKKAESHSTSVGRKRGATETSMASTNGSLDRALAIIAAEVGVSTSELSDNDANFADYGVDSLLSLTITGRLREELDIELPSSVFIDYPNFSQFQALLAEKTGAPVAHSSSSASSGTLTDDDFSLVFSGSATESSTPPTELSSEGVSGIQEILAEEIGLSPNEVGSAESLAELGLDSLLSLTVVGRIREELGLELPNDFFIVNGTLESVQKALGSKSACGKDNGNEVIEQATTRVSKEMGPARSTTTVPPATSILLQGNPQTATHILFLFPDGSGSATSYSSLPQVSADTCVYGLNCPYVKNPEDMKCRLDELTTPYVAEIRRRQPKGPYNLSGWSAGGISAYDAMIQLYAMGERVERLILLDSPNPIGLEKLPPRLYDYFESLGMFDSVPASSRSRLIKHFLMFIDALDTYKAQPFPAELAPKTHIVWAQDGVCKGDDRNCPVREDDPREMKWLLLDRSDLGPNGWDTLVGKENINIEVLPGTNHFSMMQGENAKRLAAFIGRALK